MPEQQMQRQVALAQGQKPVAVKPVAGQSVKPGAVKPIAGVSIQKPVAGQVPAQPGEKKNLWWLGLIIGLVVGAAGTWAYFQFLS